MSVCQATGPGCGDGRPMSGCHIGPVCRGGAALPCAWEVIAGCPDGLCWRYRSAVWRRLTAKRVPSRSPKAAPRMRRPHCLRREHVRARSVEGTPPRDLQVLRPILFRPCPRAYGDVQPPRSDRRTGPRLRRATSSPTRRLKTHHGSVPVRTGAADAGGARVGFEGGASAGRPGGRGQVVRLPGRDVGSGPGSWPGPTALPSYVSQTSAATTSS